MVVRSWDGRCGPGSVNHGLEFTSAGPGDFDRPIRGRVGVISERFGMNIGRLTSCMLPASHRPKSLWWDAAHLMSRCFCVLVHAPSIFTSRLRPKQSKPTKRHQALNRFPLALFFFLFPIHAFLPSHTTTHRLSLLLVGYAYARRVVCGLLPSSFPCLLLACLLACCFMLHYAHKRRTAPHVVGSRPSITATCGVLQPRPSGATTTGAADAVVLLLVHQSFT